MRIKFIQIEDYSLNPLIIGQEWQGEVKAKGHTIVSGYPVASNGILKPFAKDITEYDKEGNEVIPEVEVG